MGGQAISNTVFGVRAYHASPRISKKGVLCIAAAHAGVLALVASWGAAPMPAVPAAVTVQLVPPLQAPAPEVVPPRPKPVERVPTPKPVARPAQPQVLASQATAAMPAAPAPAPREIPPPAPLPAPSAPAVSQPRFDVDYLNNPAPVYPPMSRRLGEEGAVTLRVFVEPSGLPGRIEIKAGSGSQRLDQAALDAVSRWKFVAARRGDEAVGAWVLVPISFTLRG